MEDADRSPDAAQDVDMGTAMVRPGYVERVESSSDLPVERAGVTYAYTHFLRSWALDAPVDRLPPTRPRLDSVSSHALTSRSLDSSPAE